MLATFMRCIALTLMVLLPASCERAAPPAPAARDPEVKLFEQRALDLKQAFLAKGGPNEAARAELTDLVADIKAWRERTGSNAITIREPDVAPPDGGNAPLIDGTCHCELATFKDNLFCYLVGTGDCKNLDDKACVYICIFLDPGPVS